MTEISRVSYQAIEGKAWKGSVLVDSDHAVAASALGAWQAWISMLMDEPLRIPDARVLKTSDTAELLAAKAPLGPFKRLVCKQFKVGGTKDLLVGFVRRSPARRSFRRARAMQRAGIGTATPIAWIERTSPRSSWLITDFLEKVVDLDSYVLSVLPRISPRQRLAHRRRLAEALAQVFRRLGQAGLYHRDMKASNLLIDDWPEVARTQVYIVDLEGMGRMHPARSRWKPIERLAASLLQYSAVTRTDYARFLQAYLRAGQEDPKTWRTHFLRLHKKAARYAQAARKRKSEKLDGYSG